VDAEAVAALRLRSFRGVTAVALRGIGVRALGLVGSVILARLLLPRDFGLLALGFTIVAVGSFFTDAGLAAGLIRSRAGPTREQLTALLAVQLTITTALVTLAAVPMWRSGTGGRVSTVMLVSLVPGVFRVPAVVQLERDLNFGAIAIVEVLETVFYTVTSIGLVVAGLGVWGVAVATVVRPVLGVALLQRAAPMRVLRPGRHWKAIAPMLAFGLTLQGGWALVLVRDQGINLATVALAGTTTLGFWTLAKRVMIVPFLLFESLWRVSYPAMSRLIEAGHDVRSDLLRALRLGVFLTGLVIVPLGASAPVLVPLVFGRAWLPIVPVLPLAAAGLILSGPLSAVGAGYLSAIGKVRLVVLAQFATMLPWMVVLPVLLPHIGVTAHGVAWALACLGDALVLGIALRREAGVPILRTLTPILASALVAGGTTYALVIGRNPSLPLWAAAVCGSLLIYLPMAATLAQPTVVDLWKLGQRFRRRPPG